MHSLPQANLLNPAVQIPCKVFVGMPLLSSIHVNYSNSFFSYNDLFISNPDGNLNPNFGYFLNSPGSIQDIRLELHVSLIHFGFIYKSYYFNFNIQDKADVALFYPVNMFGLIITGNTDYVGKELDLSGLKIYGNYYREWALGVSKVMNKNLTLGVKAKILFGKANLRTARNDLSLITADNTYFLTAASNLEIDASPLVLTTNTNGVVNSVGLPSGSTPLTLLLNSKNKGFGIDLGTIYKLDDKITLSGSILDLGIIYWQYFPVNASENGSFTYWGLTYNPATGQVDNAAQLGDSILNSFRFNTTTNPYFTALPPKIYIGATYNILPTLNTGLMARNELYHNKLLSSATASINAWYSRYLAGSVSWSYINGSLLNFGCGISLRTPNFGLYAISDNVYGAFKWKSARLVNIRFGLNLLFGCSSCNASNKSLTGKGCAAYFESDKKKARFAVWLDRMRKNKK
jgi:hypothetical protein